MNFFASLVQDTSFWVAFSSLLCFGFIGWKAYKPIFSALDGRAELIRIRLQEANDLHVEAERILVEYQEKSAVAQEEAANVLRNAQRRAEALRVEMEAELHETIARQELAVKLRIARIEQEAIESVKQAIIEAAMVHVRNEMAKPATAVQIDSSLQRIIKTFH